MASTSANRVSVLIENPASHRPAKAPISDTGTAIIGISVARQVCRNRNTTPSTSSAASKMVIVTSLIEASTKARGVEGNGVVDALGEPGL